MGVVHLENEHLELHFPNPLAMGREGEREKGEREKERGDKVMVQVVMGVVSGCGLPYQPHQPPLVPLVCRMCPHHRT